MERCFASSVSRFLNQIYFNYVLTPADGCSIFQGEVIVYLDHLLLSFPAPSRGQLQGTQSGLEQTPTEMSMHLSCGKGQTRVSVQNCLTKRFPFIRIIAFNSLNLQQQQTYHPCNVRKVSVHHNAKPTRTF